jgi:hypothetical protein
MTPVAEQMKRIPSAARPTVQAARRTVKSLAPKSKEITYQSEPPRSKSAMWKIVRYATQGRARRRHRGVPDVRKAFALEND